MDRSVFEMDLDPFSKLPNEILVQIFLHLSTKDLIAVSRTCQRFGQTSRDQTLLHCIDLRSSYGLQFVQLSKYLQNNSIKRHIQHVHLDNCYWINWAQDARFLRSCYYLKSLTLTGISVSLSQLLQVFNACQKIKYLSLSYDSEVEESDRYNSITALYSSGALKSVCKLSLMLDSSGVLPPPLFWQIFTNVEELSLIFPVRVNRKVPYFYEDTLFTHKLRGIQEKNLPKLKKFITMDITGKLYLSSYSTPERKLFPDLTLNRTLDRSFLNRWSKIRSGGLLSDANGNAIMGPTSAILYRLPAHIQPWPTLMHLGILLSEEVPETLAKILSTCKQIVSLVIFFNFDCNDQSKICATVSSYQRQLKKFSIIKKNGAAFNFDLENLELPKATHLSLPVTVISYPQGSYHEQNQYMMKDSHQNGFKKPRIGVTEIECPDLLPLGLCVLGCSNLSVLEIGVSEGDQMTPKETSRNDVPASMKPVPECLSSIRHLKSLTHLTLHNLPIRNGSFLINIAEHCKELKSIRLKNLGPSAMCCYTKHLCIALQYCTNLRDLRIEQRELSCANFMKELSKHCQQLQRLVIIAPHRSFGKEDILFAINNIKTLVFGYFTFDFILQNDQETVQKRVRKLKKFRPELYVYCDNGQNSYGTGSTLDIPLFHKMEMVDVNSWARMHNL